MSIPHFPVIIIGGGQAGLSVSWYLCAEGIRHLVLERHGRFESWRNNRWDSFCLVTPNWQCRLPGWPYRGPDPAAVQTAALTRLTAQLLPRVTRTVLSTS